MGKYTSTQISDSQTNLNAALQLARAGYALFPAKANKKPYVSGWKQKATTDIKIIRKWFTNWPDAMPAIPTGAMNGVAVLDVDLKDKKNGFETLRKLGFDPDSPTHTAVTTPSGGKHLYFRYPKGLRCSASKIGTGVDVRADGGYVIAPGAVSLMGEYKSGKFWTAYDLIGQFLPWPEKLGPAKHEPKKSSGQKTGLHFDRFSEAVMAIPNNDSNPEAESREWWINIGMGIHHETDGSSEGLTLFHQFSTDWPTYDFDEIDSVWQSIDSTHKTPRTGASVLAEARKHGWVDQTPLYEIQDYTVAIAEVETQAETKKTRSRLQFLSPSDCEKQSARQYVVKGLIAEGDIAAIIGAPGAGKSLLGPRLGYAVAQGEPVFERRTKVGKVFYVATEDENGMRGRVKALKAQHGDAKNFSLVAGVSDLLIKNSEDLKALALAVREQRPKLIIIDTLAMAFPGLEENDAANMGRVVAVARKLTKWGAAVVLIHHDTKAGNDGLPRGHSILNGALDISIHLKRDGDVVVGKPTKNRNGTTEQQLGFKVGVVQQGIDEDGDPVTTAICQEVDAADIPKKSKKLPPSIHAAFSILEKLLDGRSSVPTDEWRDACIGSEFVSIANSKNDRRQAFRRAVVRLENDNLIVSHEGSYSIYDPRIESLNNLEEKNDIHEFI